jgi:CRP/FNR family cyclic AMP-dependent transcriptional regulator
MSDNSKNKHFKKGQTLFKEGEAGNSFFIIREGAAEISVMNNGEKVVLAKAEKGDSVGEFAFITKKNRTATVIALENVEAVEISEEMYRKLFEEFPYWAQTMIQELVKKLVSSTELIKKSQSKNQELLNALDIIIE